MLSLSITNFPVCKLVQATRSSPPNFRLLVVRAPHLHLRTLALRDPPWLTLIMSFTQFTVGGLSPLSPSTKTDVKGTQWVTLESRGDWSIHPEAISSTQPQLWADEWDIDECKPKILDWTEFADWYDRSYHWRGWIPEKALGNSIIPLPNKKMAPYDPAKEPLL